MGQQPAPRIPLRLQFRSAAGHSGNLVVTLIFICTFVVAALLALLFVVLAVVTTSGPSSGDWALSLSCFNLVLFWILGTGAGPLARSTQELRLPGPSSFVGYAAPLYCSFFAASVVIPAVLLAIFSATWIWPALVTGSALIGFLTPIALRGLRWPHKAMRTSDARLLLAMMLGRGARPRSRFAGVAVVILALAIFVACLQAQVTSRTWRTVRFGLGLADAATSLAAVLLLFFYHLRLARSLVGTGGNWTEIALVPGMGDARAQLLALYRYTLRHSLMLIMMAAMAAVIALAAIRSPLRVYAYAVFLTASLCLCWTVQTLAVLVNPGPKGAAFATNFGSRWLIFYLFYLLPDMAIVRRSPENLPDILILVFVAIVIIGLSVAAYIPWRRLTALPHPFLQRNQ